MDRLACKTWLCSIVVAAAVAFSASTSNAQTVVAYRDGDGEWQWMEPDRSQAFARKGGFAEETIGGIFTVTYEDLAFATGVGFDDPVSGAARRETLRAVLRYLSTVLDVPGTADLLVGSSQTDGGGPLAAGSPFLLPVTGFQGGLVFEHLTTGVDPLPDLLDGTLAVDFGFRWNSDADGPSRIEYDLYTALLHEVTHALGFFSVVGRDARSVLLNVDDRGLFSLLDAFLIRGSTERPLYLEGGVIDASPEDVTGGDLLFAGSRASVAFGSFPPVFAPNPFLEGSSIGHWSVTTGTDVAMLPGLDRGERRREYEVWELQALGDLGYDVVACGDGFVAGAEQCDDGNAEDLDGCSRTCEVEPVIAPDASVPDASVPDASVLDASVPDARVPDGAIGDNPPPASREPSRNPRPDDIPGVLALDGGLPAASSSHLQGGCTVRNAGADTAWPILLALLLGVRRRRAID